MAMLDSPYDNLITKAMPLVMVSVLQKIKIF